MPPDTSDTAGPPDYTTCVGLSAECLEDVSCACLERTGVADEVATCSGTAATGLHVVIAHP